MFVSHNMGAIRRLCQTGVFLNNGMLTAYDQVDNIIDLYTKDGAVLHENKSFEHYKDGRSGTGEITFTW